MSGLALGYEFEHEDVAALEAGSAPYQDLMASNDAPVEIDYGNGFTIRNQSSRPACRGHSLAAVARMSARVKAAGPIDLDENGTPGEPLRDDFSPMWCWVRSQQHGGTVGANRGATMQGGVKVGIEDGICREVMYPYSASHTTRLPESMLTDGARFKFGRYSTLKTEQQVHDWLASGQGPCEWGTMWPFRWIGGCLADVAPNGRGGHATAIRGYWTGKRVADSVPAVARYVANEPYVYVCENSHGPNAQWRGLYFVTRRGMAATLADRGTHLLGWSDLSYPLFRRVDWSKVRLV